MTQISFPQTVSDENIFDYINRHKISNPYSKVTLTLYLHAVVLIYRHFELRRALQYLDGKVIHLMTLATDMSLEGNTMRLRAYKCPSRVRTSTTRRKRKDVVVTSETTLSGVL